MALSWPYCVSVCVAPVHMQTQALGQVREDENPSISSVEASIEVLHTSFSQCLRVQWRWRLSLNYLFINSTFLSNAVLPNLRPCVLLNFQMKEVNYIIQVRMR